MATIILIGNVTADLELKKAESSGTSYVTFNLAENNYINGAQETTYYQCSLFGNAAERIINAKVKRGSCLQVMGRLELSVYQKKDKSTGHTLKVSVTDWSYTPTGRKSEDKTSEDSKPSTAKENSENKNTDFSETEISSEDGDLPF